MFTDKKYTLYEIPSTVPFDMWVYKTVINKRYVLYTHTSNGTVDCIFL